MSQIPSSIGSTNQARSNTANQVSSALADVNIDQFLDLMIAELQNQDPLDPTDSSDFLRQLSQIREIGASDKLTSTLETVLDGQNLTTASGLIGKEVTALSTDGDQVQGRVDRVTVEVDGESGKRTLQVHIGEQSFGLNRIREVKENSTN